MALKMEVFVRYAIELAIIIPDAVFIFLPALRDLRWRVWGTVCALSALLTGFILTMAWLCAAHLWPVIPILVVSVAFLFVLFFFSVKLSPGRKLFCFFNAIMLGAFCLLYSIIVMVPYVGTNELWTSVRLLSLESGLASFGLSLLMGLIFLRALAVEIPMLMREERLSGIWNFLFWVPLVVLLLICWMTPITPSFLLVGRFRIFSLLLLPLLPFIILMLYHLLWWVTVKFSESTRLQQENTLLQMEGKRYEALKRYMEDTRALRHDFHNHLLVISDLARAGQTEKLLDYLSPLAGTAEGYVGYSSNKAVDAVAAHYAALADAQRTQVEWKLQVPASIPIREADFCAILGNLLENALRAVSGLPATQRRVTVISSMLSGEMMGIAIDNPFDGDLQFDQNGLPRSGRKGHGIGLVSVLNTVQRYNGSMNIKAEGGVFSVEILLCAAVPRGEKGEEEIRGGDFKGVFLL